MFKEIQKFCTDHTHDLQLMNSAMIEIFKNHDFIFARGITRLFVTS